MKKSKKLVLAALVLLAITGLLALAGCKNDSVPETPAAKLVSISVTPPARTVYKVGDEVVHKKDGEIGVTAHYDNETTRPVTGTITTDTSTLTQSAGIGKPVTVSYKEGDTTKEATFTIDVASYEFTETVQNVDSSYAGTMTGRTYKKFGDWPQTIKEESVEIGAGTLVRGGLTYHVGSDGNYYVETEEKANGSGTAYRYSNGDKAGQGGTSTKWFKVEPIVWRVLTTSYKLPPEGGNALLLAEKILTGGIKWADSSNNYKESYIRQWLNGNSGTGETSDYNGDAGFLQTAFTQSALGKIVPTTVDNSAASTTDKIFLLSEEEATNSEYGFGAYDDLDIARIRVTTDYAKAIGAYQGNPSAGYGGRWWLRSSFSINGEDYACGINIHGCADSDLSALGVKGTYGGVVPALSISLQ